MWWCLIRNVFKALLFRSVYMICSHRLEAVTAKFKFHESAIYILRPQKSSFELPKDFKTDFTRKKNALLRGISFLTLAHVPVNDFSRWILSILTCEKSLKLNVNNWKSSKNSLLIETKKIIAQNDYHYLFFPIIHLLFWGNLFWYWNGGLRNVRYESPWNTARERRNQDDLRTPKIIIGSK